VRIDRKEQPGLGFGLGVQFGALKWSASASQKSAIFQNIF